MFKFFTKVTKNPTTKSKNRNQQYQFSRYLPLIQRQSLWVCSLQQYKFIIIKRLTSCGLQTRNDWDNRHDRDNRRDRDYRNGWDGNDWEAGRSGSSHSTSHSSSVRVLVEKLAPILITWRLPTANGNAYPWLFIWSSASFAVPSSLSSII